MLGGIFGMLVLVTGDERMELSAKESEAFAGAIADVQAVTSAKLLSPETAAWVNLAMIGGPIVLRRAGYMLSHGKKPPAQRTNGPIIIDATAHSNPSAPPQ